MKILKQICAVAWLLFSITPAFAQADDWQLSQLMQSLSQNKTGEAVFTEKKYIGIISQPIVSSGELSFTAPDKLQKRTLKPIPESLMLNGNMLTIERPNKRRITVSLEEHPEVSAFIDSIRGTLAGDLLALEKHYTLTLTGSAEKWQLLLVPKQEFKDNIFSQIRINGSYGDLKTIDVSQNDGDHAEMLITKINNR